MKHDSGIPALFRTQDDTADDTKRLSDQELAILNRLREGPADEIDLREASGSHRVAARIYNLRQAGHNIASFRSSRKCGGYKLVDG